MHAELPEVPAHLSLEGRAVLIADAAGALYKQPEDRRRAVEALALSHMRAALDQGLRVLETRGVR